jgi:hypothetical protein
MAHSYFRRHPSGTPANASKRLKRLKDAIATPVDKLAYSELSELVERFQARGMKGTEIANLLIRFANDVLPAELAIDIAHNRRPARKFHPHA